MLQSQQVAEYSEYTYSYSRIVTNHRKYAHVIPILKQLRWLPVKYRCMLKAATLVYKF